MSDAGKRTTRAERAARAARMAAEQQRAERRRRQLWITGAVAVALVLAVVVGIVISQQTSSVGKQGVATPAHTSSDDGYVVGSAQAGSGVPHVVAYEDFICPYCGQFEADAGSWLLDQAVAGALVVEYRPIAFLDQNSTTHYSTRAANAAACVADQAGVDGFAAMHTELFAHQPEEGSAGLTDDQLAALADNAGADLDAVSQCIDAGTFNDWVAQATDLSSQQGVTGTPTVTVDGTPVTPGGIPTLADIKTAVAAAQ